MGGVLTLMLGTHEAQLQVTPDAHYSEYLVRHNLATTQHPNGDPGHLALAAL